MPVRLAGDGREATSAAIALHVFPNGADTVYVAEGASGLAPALAAGTLTDGPVLLVNGTRPPSVAISAAIGTLDPEQVVALGDTSGGVSDATLTALAGTRRFERILGADAFELAANIATRGWPDGADHVYLAEAVELADGLAGGTLRDGPILLVPSTGSVPVAVTQAVAAIDPTQIVSLGGDAAVSDALLDQISDGRGSGRLEGPTRFETAVAISQAAFPSGAQTVYLARADIAPDAVVAGAVTDGPILLVESCNGIHPSTDTELGRLQPDHVIALGGTAAICEDTIDQVIQPR